MYSQDKMKLKVGLLPLYLNMYDEIFPEVKIELNLFLKRVTDLLTQRGIDVVSADICGVSRDFETAINQFENENVDSIVTLHLAYSPSLECIDSLCKTELPIVVMDTTRDKKFDSISLLMYNHGIHGVQDMCNLLLQRGKTFFLEAGHIDSSDVVNRIIQHVKGARIAKEFKSSRVGQIGENFEGMGDFVVEPERLATDYGIQIIKTSPLELEKYYSSANKLDIFQEMQNNTTEYDLTQVSEESHYLSTQIGQVLKRWISNYGLTGFTINFKAVRKNSGLPMMPFFEICKLMKNGKIGYAGEGDILTAALTGALSSVLSECSFAEMFCPDWENDTIFLSHMGEINFEIIEDKAKLIEMEWLFTDAERYLSPSACFKSGEATLVCLAPKSGGNFSLITAPVILLNDYHGKSFGDGIRGWMKPLMPVPEFLKKYSEAGGIHHMAIVYGTHLATLKTFGEIMNWQIIELT